ncbi:MAG: hypothetical protein H0X17_15445 [Deltaproteobacteria bacterium]|nr:hypothetical protein [Deltaproteobacteria bacterium]
MSNPKLVMFLLAGLVGACASDPGDGGGDDGGGEDAPPFTNGVSMLSGHAEAGYVDGKRGEARFANPVNVAHANGKVYVADFDNSKIREVDAADGTTTTLISQQGFSRPFAMAFAGDGTMYVSTDRGPENQQGLMAGTIWRVDINARTATPIANGIGRPRGIAVLPTGKLAVTDYQHHVVSIVDPVTGNVSPLAGAWDAPGMTDAAGAAALFNGPYGVVVKDGKLIVADYGNHRLREVSLDGSVRTLAGAGTAGFADGAMPTAQFSHPQGVTISGTGDVYVTDLENYRIRKITASSVETLAGSGTPGYADDDNLANADFYGLEGLSVSNDGSKLYVADGGRGENAPYNRVRVVNLR